jgi:hypothetical protein
MNEESINLDNPVEIPEVTVSAQNWKNHKRQYQTDNPLDIDKEVNNRFNNPIGRERISKINPKAWKSVLKQEQLTSYEDRTNDYVASKIVEDKPQGTMSRADWLNTLSDEEEALVKRIPANQPTIWNETKRGIESGFEETIHEIAYNAITNKPISDTRAFKNIMKSKSYSTREKHDMVKSYSDNAAIAKVGDQLKIIGTLDILPKAVQASYRDDYRLEDLIAGKRNDASWEENLISDPLNILGIGALVRSSGLRMASALSNVNSGVKSIKAAEALNILAESKISKLDKFKNAMSNIDATLGKAISSNSKVDRPRMIEDANALLTKGVGIKKNSNLNVKLVADPKIKHSINVMIDPVGNGEFVKSGSMFLTDEHKLNKSFSSIIKSKINKKPIDGLSKDFDFPTISADRNVRKLGLDPVDTKGLGAEVGEALKQSMQKQGDNFTLFSSADHSEEGQVRYLHNVLKGRQTAIPNKHNKEWIKEVNKLKSELKGKSFSKNYTKQLLLDKPELAPTNIRFRYGEIPAAIGTGTAKQNNKTNKTE